MREESYRVRYSVEGGEWHLPKSDADKKPRPGVRVLADPKHSNYGYTDNLIICSILREEGKIVSILWMIDPHLSPQEVAKLPESLQHHLDEHHGKPP